MEVELYRSYVFDMVLSDDSRWLALQDSLASNDIGERKKRLADFLVYCLDQRGWSYKVKTADSYLDSSEYAVNFADSFVDSGITTLKVDREEFNSETDTPRILYHGTNTSSLPSIMIRGIVPCYAPRPWKGYSRPLVFMTQSLCIAEFFAKCASTNHGGYPLVLVVDSTSLREPIAAKESFTYRKHVFACYTQFIYVETVFSSVVKDMFVLPKRRLLYTLVWKLKKQCLNQARCDYRN